MWLSPLCGSKLDLETRKFPPGGCQDDASALRRQGWQADHLQSFLTFVELLIYRPGTVFSRVNFDESRLELLPEDTLIVTHGELQRVCPRTLPRP